MNRRNERNDAEAFDDALSGRTPRDADIAALVRATEKFLEAAAVEPELAFRDSLRFELMSEAETVLVAHSKSTPTVVRVRPASAPATASPTRRRIAGITAALVASMGAVGLVSSSASAIPGDALYPVKRGVENVALAFHRGDASEGSFQLARASERLAEARALTDDGESAEQISQILVDFSGQANDGSDSLLSDYSSNGSKESIDKVNNFAAASSAALAELASRVPAGATAALEQASAVVSDLAVEASALCSTCSTIQVQSLVDAVSKLAAGTPTEPTSTSTDDPTKVETPDAGALPRPSATPKPAVVLPQPTAPPTSLGEITDPLVGILLGDDDQQGLVPGVLGGLLGGGTNP